MSRRLKDYLDYMDGSFGCFRKYEDYVFQEDTSEAYKAGWYSGMVDEIIELVGKQRLIRLVSFIEMMGTI